MILTESFILSAHDWVPNNPKLPVILYRDIFDAGDAKRNASQFEKIFARHGWPPQWRNGVYPFHHYHSTAHEVLAFAFGRARLMLGGPDGREVEVKAGDVVLLPAGTGHCRVSSTDDFLVIGAYPPEQKWDICRQAVDATRLRQIVELPFPDTDPVEGAQGTMVRLWAGSS